MSINSGNKFRTSQRTFNGILHRYLLVLNMSDGVGVDGLMVLMVLMAGRTCCSVGWTPARIHSDCGISRALNSITG